MSHYLKSFNDGYLVMILIMRIAADTPTKTKLSKHRSFSCDQERKKSRSRVTRARLAQNNVCFSNVREVFSCVVERGCNALFSTLPLSVGCTRGYCSFIPAVVEQGTEPCSNFFFSDYQFWSRHDWRKCRTWSIRRSILLRRRMDSERKRTFINWT